MRSRYDVNADYEYDPYGNQVRALSFANNGNPNQFSTKYTDSETALVYYGRRFYTTSRSSSATNPLIP